MLTALLRRRGRASLAVAARSLAVAARRRRRSRSAARPTSSSTTAARSTATRRRSPTFEEETGKKLELRGGTAPELFERLRSEGDDTPADLLVTTDLANLWRAEGGRAARAGARRPRSSATCPRQCRDPDGDWWGLSLRIRTPMRSTERVPEDAVHELRGPRRPALEGQALPAHVEQRVQPVARRRHARQARRGGDRRALLRVLDGQRPADPRLRRRRARRDRRRPLRRRADQPLLPRAASSTTTRTSPSRPPGPTRTAPARTRTSPASGSSRAPSTARTRSR